MLLCESYQPAVVSLLLYINMFGKYGKQGVWVPGWEPHPGSLAYTMLVHITSLSYRASLWHGLATFNYSTHG